MRIQTRTLVSNSEMIKNYKECREKADALGKIVILKNNKPDAVLFSIAEYERIAPMIERLDELPDEEATALIASFDEV